MDREHLGSLLFLSSLATLTVGCAGGSGGPAPRPSPYGTNGGDDGSGDPWTDPLETSGGSAPAESKGSGDTGGWPNEGETGAVPDGTSGGADPSPDDGDSTGMGATSETPAASSGDSGESSTGYDPPVGDDPCPDLAQLYADCDADYTYESEIALCQQARASAQAISPACGSAHAEFLACLSTLDCATLFQPGTPLACVIQGAATDLACSS